MRAATSLSLKKNCEQSFQRHYIPGVWVEEWHHILTKLVEVQADGRAVTMTLPYKYLQSYAIQHLKLDPEIQADIDRVTKVIEFLRGHEVAILNPDIDPKTLALGHDSVALSLNKWSVRSGRDNMMMMRMRMTGATTPDKYTTAQLFPTVYGPKGKKYVEKPHRTKVLLHRDHHWDRQFPHFAEQEGFASHLEIDFVLAGDEYDLVSPDAEKRPPDWPTAAERLSKLERETYDRRVAGDENVRVMVAADWHAFPWREQEATEQAGKRKKARKISPKDREEVGRWSDICVTNLFTGNALIGSYYEHKDRLDRDEAYNSERPREHFIRTIRSSLETLKKENGIVRCHDELSMRFLMKAAELCCGKRSAVLKYLKDSGVVEVFKPEKGDESPFPLADWYLGKGMDKETRPRFIVGTAAIRSIVLQSGGYLYFSVSEMTLSVRHMIDEQVRLLGSGTAEALEEQENLIDEVQQVIKHTIWQPGLAPSQWNQRRNRSLVLRLASVGYYTKGGNRSLFCPFSRFD